MTDEELVQGILDGCSLRTFMVPDADVTYDSDHIESYELPLVVIDGNHFWGKSVNGHFNHIPGNKQMEVIAYCYTNSVEFFCAFNSTDNGVAVMHKDRYKTHEWGLIREFKLIWDSAGDRSAETIAGEIEAGAKFRIAMLDGEGIWNIHPVCLPMFEKESNRFQLRTAWDRYPAFFRTTPRLDSLIGNYQDFQRQAANALIARLSFTPPVFECFYSLTSGGIPGRNTKG